MCFCCFCCFFTLFIDLVTDKVQPLSRNKVGYRRSVFLVVETLSQRPALVRNNKDHVLRHLLPALAVLVDDNGANGANDPMDVLLTLRMIGKRESVVGEAWWWLVVAGGGWWWLVVAGGGMAGGRMVAPVRVLVS